MSIYKETQGQGKDLVIIHGWSHDHHYMKPIIDLLSDQYRLTIVDLPGLGQSSWDAGIETMHDFVDRLLPSLPDSAIYVSWSFGGQLSLALASKHPERVKHLIAVASTPKFIAADGWPGFPQPGFKVMAEEMRKVGFKNFLKSFHDYEYECTSPDCNNRAQLNEIYQQHSSFDEDIISAGMSICDDTDLREDMKLIQCPIDFICGELDETTPIEDHNLIQQLNPLAKHHVIAGARHMPFWTFPKEFADKLNEVLLTAR